MIGKYTGVALETHNKIANNMRVYTPNKIYYNGLHQIYWYKNSRGYLHILRPTRCKVSTDPAGVPVYILRDFLLINENTLKATDKRRFFSSKASMELYLNGGVL